LFLLAQKTQVFGSANLFSAHGLTQKNEEGRWASLGMFLLVLRGHTF
jgi:hypothetical protein